MDLKETDNIDGSLQDHLSKLKWKLEEASLRSIKDIAERGPNELSNPTGLDNEICYQICEEIKAIPSMKITNSHKPVEREGISTGSKSLDKLFKGHGIELGRITQLYGASGSAKTQLCHSICVNVPLPSNTIYVDSEGTFRPERILQIARARGMNSDIILQKTRVAKPIDSKEQEGIVEQICKEIVNGHDSSANTKLVIIDSIISHYEADYPGRSNLAQRQHKLSKTMYMLERMARSKSIAVVVTNHVLTNPDEYADQKIVPAGGNVMAYTCKHRVRLSRVTDRQFGAKLEYSYRYPYDSVGFVVDERGVSDRDEDERIAEWI